MTDERRSKEHILRKREQLENYIHTELEGHPGVRGVVLTGSVATGDAREDSDIDITVFLNPFRKDIMPHEFIWDPKTREYFSIWDEHPGVQIDAKRLDLEKERRREWKEAEKSELAEGIIIFDREGQIRELLNDKLVYPEKLRLDRLIENEIRIDYYLTEWRLMMWIERGGALQAHYLLNIAVDEILESLYAYNRIFMPWEYRKLYRSYSLPWLPANYRERIEEGLLSRSLSEDDVKRRLEILKKLYQDISDKLREEGLIPDCPFEYYVENIENL